MHGVFSCADNDHDEGSAVGALLDAARFVTTLKPDRVRHIIGWQDDKGDWWIDVVYFAPRTSNGRKENEK